jgi:hypothetical protein
MQARMLRQAAVTGIGLMGPATLVLSACAMMALASPAQALQYGAPSWLYLRLLTRPLSRRAPSAERAYC